MRALLLLSLLCLGALVDGQVNITINWNNVFYTSKTSTTLQVVVNPYVQRGSPIHDGTFSALQNLQADYVRFVPWFPYPQLGVAELQPPTGNPVCATINNTQTFYLECAQGVFEQFNFVSYGTPDGSCGEFSVGRCNANNSLELVEKFCLGLSACQFNVTDDVFGDPCPSLVKRLAVQAQCSISVDKTSWNFTLIDPLMEDFMNATQNHSVIINFSTTPEWMWNSPKPVDYPADPQEVFWEYEQGNDLRDNSLQDLANYYKRLVGWYTNGGFYDEYSVYHHSGHYYNIPMWEVLNEVEYEHSMTPQSYTAIYDAIVLAILEIQPNMTFVGLALEGREPTWVEYFLNASNHKPGVPLDWISYHFYAGCQSRENVSQYEGFFPQADAFFQEVQILQTIRSILAPHVRTTIDEIGVILPNDTAKDPGPIPNLYWNAAGALYAYVYGNLITQGIEVLGESQLVGYPTQFPSVSLMDWTNGVPNSRYWVLYLLHSQLSAGDRLVETDYNSNNLFAQAFLTKSGKKVLLINKSLEPIAVSFNNITTGTVTYVDETTYESPPASISLSQSSFKLNPFSVAVVTAFST